MSNGEYTITVSEEGAGARLDAFLALELSGVSRSSVRRAIDKADCLVNDRPAKPSYKVHAGDSVQIEIASPPPVDATPENIPLDIVFEDDEIIVVDKPAGMIMHPGAGVSSGTLANALAWHFGELSHGDGARPGIVHRLDIGTSGIVIAAKTEQAHRHLSAQFEDRTVEKRYLALVYGTLEKQNGRIDLPIGRDPRNRIKMAVTTEGKGRPALTLYEVSERFDDFTLLTVQIKTGRTHQIRVHLSHLNHPVVGDETYDKGRMNSVRSAQTRAAIGKLSRPFLHAARLAFTHPETDQRLAFESPLPDELSGFLDTLRHHNAQEKLVGSGRGEKTNLAIG